MPVHKRLVHIAPKADVMVKAQRVFANLYRQLQIVRNHNYCYALPAVDFAKHGIKFFFGVRVNAGCRFVKQKQLRAAHHGPCQIHALLLAAAKLAYFAVRQFF